MGTISQTSTVTSGSAATFDPEFLKELLKTSVDSTIDHYAPKITEGLKAGAECCSTVIGTVSAAAIKVAVNTSMPGIGACASPLIDASVSVATQGCMKYTKPKIDTCMQKTSTIVKKHTHTTIDNCVDDSFK